MAYSGFEGWQMEDGGWKLVDVDGSCKMEDGVWKLEVRW